jgi:hypothetical protein
VALPLDHVPFYRCTEATLRAFLDLGFVCSPRGSYRSPQFPSSVWETNCVFLQQGWFDLLRGSRRGAQSEATVPGACLFLTGDMEKSIADLDATEITARYSLERRWQGSSVPGERFDLASLSRSPCQLPAAIIQHDWPCDDVKAEWTAHPNGAVRLEAVFCSTPTANPTTISSDDEILDSSLARDITDESFRVRFGTDQFRVAVRIRVADLGVVRHLLRSSGLQPSSSTTGTVAVCLPGLACVFEFVQQ